MTAPPAQTPKQQAVMAAMDVAESVVAGTVDPTQLDAAVVAECRRLFAAVDGPDDPLWPTHVEVARQVLAVGGIPADELAEWAAVQRLAEGKPADDGPSWIEATLAALDDDEGDDDA